MAKAKYVPWITADGLTCIRGWARDGMVDEAIARRMGISASTFYGWQEKHPEIRQALQEGKAPVDAMVEESLLSMACGFTKKIKKIFKVKKERYDSKGRKITVEELEEREEEIYIPPNVEAQKFWLAHRKKAVWGDPKESEAEAKTRDADFELIIAGEGDGDVQ